MTVYEKSLAVLTELFGRDFQFALATSYDNVPAVRTVDTYYDNGVFWIVTYGKSNKVREMEANPNVALCHNLYSFSGKAFNAGHPLKSGNKAIREKLIKAFEPWYFAHNDENDENMCYIRVELSSGFFYKDGMGYKVDFIGKTADAFSFRPDIEFVN